MSRVNSDRRLSRTAISLIAGATSLGLLLCVASLPARAAGPGDDVLRIGSKRFTESYILAELIGQTARPHAKTRISAGLGNTAIVFEALRTGAIDVYPEYLGTIDREILKNPSPSTLDEINRRLAPMGLGAAIRLGFNNGYALAMRADRANRLGVASVGDLAKHPDLKLGLSNEFIGRADGWPGLAARYRLGQTPIAIDHGLAYPAIEAGQVDVIDIYTTDAKIDSLGLRALADDLGYFPRYDAVLLYRLDVPRRFPEAWNALSALEGRIDESAMIAMNARAELQGVAFDRIAREFLAGGEFVSRARGGLAARLFGDDLWRLTGQHLLLVVVSVGVAALVGIPLGIAAASFRRLRAVVLGIAGVLQTVPSLAMLAILISAIGAIGTVPALVALALYALLPIVRNTCTGLADGTRGYREAGLALGLSRPRVLQLIELPLATPTIVAGIRTATVICVGTATIAAFVGAGGYGERIVTGLALNDRDLLLAGAIPSAALALLLEAGFELFDRRFGRWRRPR